MKIFQGLTQKFLRAVALGSCILACHIEAAPAPGSAPLAEQLVLATLEGSEKNVLSLLAAGADINAPAGPGLTAWHAAKMRGRPLLAEMLAKRGADTSLPMPPPAKTIDWIARASIPAGSPGLALAVVRDGSIIFKGGWGLASLDYDVPITPSTVFHVASVSKQFTAFAIALLAEEGKLSVDDDYRKHLPDMPDFGRQITLRHLLYHTSGMRDQWDLLVIAGWRMDDVITQKDILGLLRRQRELNFDPGSAQLYCNSGYTLLAEVASRVSGEAFPEFMRQRVFDPLGMTNTHFHIDHERIVRNMAYSYAPLREGGFKKSVLSYANAGATSLFTTVEDLAKWIANFERPAVASTAVGQMIRDNGRLNNGSSINYGFGLTHGKFRNARTLGHGGADAGYRSYVLWLPDHHLGVALLSNLGSIDAAELAHGVVETYLYADLAPVTERPQSSPTNAAPRYKLDAARLDDYTGAYQGQSGRIITITRDGDSLKGDVRAGKAQGLIPVAPHEFTLAEGNGRIVFAKADSGKASRYTLDLGGEQREYLRVSPEAATPPALEDYVGFYYCRELDLGCPVFVKDGKLVIRHRRIGEITLRTVSRDRFTASTLGNVRFERDAGDKISALRLTTGRVINLRFTRSIEL